MQRRENFRQSRRADTNIVTSTDMVTSTDIVTSINMIMSTVTATNMVIMEII
jgi:hypothetical protein